MSLPNSPRALHPWPRSPRAAVRLQRSLQAGVIPTGSPGRIRRVAGADISYDRGDDRLYTAVVLLSVPGLEIIEIATTIRKAWFPYIPGLLSFREAPAVIACFRRLRGRPDVAILDGHGIAHPRGVGLASHVGLWLDFPTIGCAKTRLVGEETAPGPARGDTAPLLHKGRRIGALLRSREGTKPVYVSVGHRIGLRSAVRCVLEATGRFRLPEPIRQAHRIVNEMRRGEDVPGRLPVRAGGGRERG